MFNISSERYVATRPFKTTRPATSKRSSGFAIMAQKTELTELEVVFSASPKGAPDLKPNDKIWVQGADCTNPWAKAVYQMPDGTEFILVPVEYIVIFAYNRVP